MVFASPDTVFVGRGRSLRRVFAFISAVFEHSARRFLFRRGDKPTAVRRFDPALGAVSRRRVFDNLAIRKLRRYQGFSKSGADLGHDFGRGSFSARLHKF